MTRSHLLALAVSVVTTAATLLVVAPATVPAQATVSVRADGDADGDGLPDAGDGCPTVASSNPTGCPTASRRATLKWAKATKRLETRVTSPVDGCSSRARIILWRVARDRDVKVVGVSTTSGGRHRFRVARGSRYYVTVPTSYASGQAECASVTSRRVLVPRR